MIGHLQVGVHDVLRKPVDPAELVARVTAALRIGRLEAELRRVGAQLQAMSQTDHLTGLANRRHLDEHLRMLASAARRQRLPLSVLMVDVDYFRRINDDAGHAAGDQVLRAVAHRMSGTMRTEDVAGRWGGEEFLVLLPATDLDGAWISGERIRSAVSRTPVALAGGGDLVVTVSVGCATGGGDDPEDQVRRADAALAEAKAAGRNRVVADTTVAL
jgi:two-component system cell cycle response regulator